MSSWGPAAPRSPCGLPIDTDVGTRRRPVDLQPRTPALKFASQPHGPEGSQPKAEEVSEVSGCSFRSAVRQHVSAATQQRQSLTRSQSPFPTCSVGSPRMG